MSINQGHYENFGNALTFSSQVVVYEVLKAIKKLNKSIIKNPGGISGFRRIYEADIKKIAKKFDISWKNWADNDLASAYIAGIRSAESQIKAFGGNTAKTSNIVNGRLLLKDFPPPPNIPEISGQINMLFSKEYADHLTYFGVFRQSAYYSLDGQYFQILRKSNDIFREISILVGEKRFSEADIFTRIGYSQDLMNEFADRGIQTITYKNGAKYSIDTYCEMLGRTLSGRCGLQANLNQMQEWGYNLCIVSAHFRSCDLCAPYEGVTLSVDGLDKRYESLADAELQGLFHCNCKHDVSPFFEGLTPSLFPSVDVHEQALIDDFGYQEAQKIAYDAQQKQRYIERQIRKYKRREITALDDISKQRANNKIREWQQKQRDLLNDNLYLKRKYTREQIKKAH